MKQQEDLPRNILAAAILLSALLPKLGVAGVSSQARIEIATPADRVWKLLSEVDRWYTWNPLVQQAVLSGPFQPDSVFKWKSKGVTVISTLQEVTPNQHITWTGKAFGTRAIHTWEIVETDNGVELRTSESFDSWLPKLMPKTMQRMLDETLPAWLKAIKLEAEREKSRRCFFALPVLD
jgi:hypothetical protein